MKKLIFESPKIVISFVLGAILFSIIGVKAATTLAASEVIYDNSSSSIQATNVQGAIDELYVKSAKKEILCKHGYYTTSNGSSNYTCTKITGTQQVITLKLTGAGFQNIFSSNFNTDNYPSFIFIDGIMQELVNNKYNFTSGGEHTVVMIWNDDIDNLLNMFNDCSSITSIDFTNFNTSQVTNMGNMFVNCSSLTSIIGLSNFNTSSVERFQYMFNGCRNIKSLDLSSFTEEKSPVVLKMFVGTSDDLKIKINCSNAPKLQTEAGSKAVCVN